VQVDFLVNRLAALDEHMKSAEDQLALELDHRRNELVALDLSLTAVATVFAFVGMIAGGGMPWSPSASSVTLPGTRACV
jgi:hypothetical protein